jgi:sugar diacid utilization regulator
MWNGKKKAITFSFDDGVMQDIRLIEILDKYGLKGTFNLNSGKFGTCNPYEVNNRVVQRTLIEPTQVKELYKNHEVAAHTVGHFNLTTLPDSCVAWQVEKDRVLLEELTGKEVFIGISEPHDDLISIPEAFEEARNAINVGRIYHSNKTIFVYRNLLLERFLNEVSQDMSVTYNGRIFNRKTARLFNEEMVHTIETFFDNSLNLSETARKLYIHRNTLVYRLERCIAPSVWTCATLTMQSPSR